MPQIPDQIAVRGVTPVGDVVARSGLTTRGTQNLGASIAQAGFDALEREDRLNYARAKNAVLVAQQDALRNLNDEEFNTYQSRYDTAINEAISDARGFIKSGRDREAFNVEIEGVASRGRDAALKRAWDKEVEVNKASLAEELEANRQAAMEAKSNDTTPMELIEGSRELIQGMRERGYLTPEEAVALSQKATQDYAMAAVSVMPWEEQVKVLQNPKDTPAQFLHEDTRKKMLKTAQDSIRTEKARAEAEEAKAYAHNLSQAYDLAYTTGEVPTQLLDELDGKDAASVTGFLARQAAGAPVTVEALAAYYDVQFELANMSPQEAQRKLVSPEFQNLRGKLPPKMFDALHDDVEKRATEQPVSINSDATTLQMTTDATDKLNLADDGDKAILFRRRRDEAIERFKLANEREPTTREVRDILDDLSADVITHAGILWDTTESEYETDEAADIPFEERARVEQALRAQGRRVTDRAVLDLYRLGQMSLERD